MSPRRSLITIDLAAVRHNVRRLKSALTGRAWLWAVVKADAYGHGTAPVAKAAVGAGADGLAVATHDEALELRDGGYTGSLLVFGPLFGSDEMRSLTERGVHFTIVSREMIDLLRHFPRGRTPPAVHLKIDSGMNRQGVSAGEVPEFLSTAAETGITVAGVMTHFACADEDPESVRLQLAAFLAGAQPVVSEWPSAIRHAANSAALLSLPETHLDMTRPGIAVYGLSPFQRSPEEHGLAPVLRWESVVVTIKDLRAGDGAGYGHAFRPDRNTRLALVPVGYADGVRRSLGGSGEVLIRGRRFPIVGRVSMDSFLVEVGPDPEVRPGDVVTLIGRDGDERITAEELARHIGTINYEVTCGIETRRAHRAFVGE